VIAYVAVSLDGFIAEADGGVDFLEGFDSDEYGYDDFLSGIDALIMGATTYEQVLGFGWPYGELPSLVLTNRDLESPEGAHVSFARVPTGEAIRAYAAGFTQGVWVVGGGEVIVAGLDDGAIDTLELYVMPVVLGAGVPLFPRKYRGALTLEATQSFSNGVVMLRYSAQL